MSKNTPIIALGVVLVIVVFVSALTYPSYQNRQKRVGDNTPIAATITLHDASPSGPTQGFEPPAVWRVLIAWPEGVTTLAVLLTLFFIAWQAILMRQTVSASREASKSELRAYLTVVIGTGFFQERRDQDKGGDLMFECRPLLVNTGHTPARKITFKARAAVMSIPLSNGTHLPENPDEGNGGSILGPQQSANMIAIVDGFRPDSEVAGIKQGIGDKGLYVWGRVTYEDIFGDCHFTRFCQHIYWDGSNNVRGNYIPGRNDAN